MRLFTPIKHLLLVASALALALPAVANTKLAGNDKNLQYTGRVDFSQAAPEISWPGTSITGAFTGKFLSVTLNDQFGKNYFNVFIDNDLAHPLVIQAKQGKQNYVVADKLASGPHSFLLTKRTEGEEGATNVVGVELADGEKLLPPPARPTRRIEFFGDSITSGMGDESPDNGPDNLQKDKNNFMAYDAVTARALNAEMHVISQSGIGIMISWFPFIMPQFYDQLSAVGDNDSHWDFSSWTPDVVVINLFQNDSWLIDREKRLKPMPSDEQRIQAYVDFVGRIRAVYPKAYIVCALGSMDATREGSKWPGYVTSAVARIREQQHDDKIDSVFFEFTGYGAHPRVKQHQANAAKLTAFIKQKMGW